MTNTAIKIQEALMAVIFCLLCYAVYTEVEQSTVSYLLLLLMSMSAYLEVLFLKNRTQELQEQIDKLNYRLFKEIQR